MKKKFLIKLAAVALFMGTVVTALPVSATSYCKETVSGKSVNTDKERIKGEEVCLRATAKNGSGTAFGHERVSGSPNKTVASVSVDATGDGDPVTDTSKYFEADGSYYYIHWSGNKNSSKAYVRFVD
ncbi:hypothetical protein FDB23_02175 [Clostridium botulinum]|nr:hypothetical protein [Clostridium botulinum]